MRKFHIFSFEYSKLTVYYFLINLKNTHQENLIGYHYYTKLLVKPHHFGAMCALKCVFLDFYTIVRANFTAKSWLNTRCLSTY